jgi:SNF2 family DNA or RNA helicase
VGNRWDKKLKTTLIVAPLALLSQCVKIFSRYLPLTSFRWKTEIETRTTGPLRVLIHHGHGRTKSTNQLRHFDVVMTTYGTLSSEHGAEVSASPSTTSSVNLSAGQEEGEAEEGAISG